MLFAREGADVAVAYLNEHDDAEETKRAVENEGRRCILLLGDAADPKYCREAVKRTVKDSASSIYWSTTRPSKSTSILSKS